MSKQVLQQEYCIGCDAHKKYSVFAGIWEAREIMPAQRVERDRESYSFSTS
jgi:hypothetical protein